MKCSFFVHNCFSGLAEMRRFIPLTSMQTNNNKKKHTNRTRKENPIIIAMAL